MALAHGVGVAFWLWGTAGTVAPVSCGGVLSFPLLAPIPVQADLSPRWEGLLPSSIVFLGWG